VSVAPRTITHTDARRPRTGDDQATALRRMVATMGEGTTHRARPDDEHPVSPTPPAPPVIAPQPRLARAIAVASGKGGVGKTNLCVNLCVHLARLGVRTTLLDADLGLANADVLCNVGVRRHIGHVIDGASALREIAVDAPGGFRLVPGGAGVAALADLPEPQLAQLLRDLGALECEADALIIDCGAGVGHVVTSFLRASDHALVITTPEPTAIADAYALIKCVLPAATSAGARGAPGCPSATRTRSVELFVNQAASRRDAERVHARINGVCERFLGASVALAGWAPHDRRVPEAVRAREPFALRHPNCGASKGVATLAAYVRDMYGFSGSETARSGFVRRMIGI